MSLLVSLPYLYRSTPTLGLGTTATAGFFFITLCLCIAKGCSLCTTRITYRIISTDHQQRRASMSSDSSPPTDPSSTSILIIGCGTWGSSTALWLARSGYKHVTVLDPYPVPSAISAGNDVNKCVFDLLHSPKGALTNNPTRIVEGSPLSQPAHDQLTH